MAVALGSTTLNNFFLGSTQLSALYVGSDKIWPVTPLLNGNIFIGNYTSSQVYLESKLTGETLTGYGTGSVFTYATSSTNYTINGDAFKPPVFNPFAANLTSYIDGGFCTSIGQNAFDGLFFLTTINFPGVNTVSINVFKNCISLTSVNLPSLSGSTALGGTTGYNGVFEGVSNTGTITVPLAYQTNNAGAPDGDLVYLKTAPRNWTINYI